MKDAIATAIATVVITGIRIGIGYAAAWVADDTNNKKENQTAEDDAEK